MAWKKINIILLTLILLHIFGAVLDASEKDFLIARQRMVREDLFGRDIKDPFVLKAMSTVQREKFVPAGDSHRAYKDHPLPIGHGQTISQPYIVALMTQLANLTGNERVLEIGTGSGYQAAVLAEISQEVYTIEIRKPLAELSADRLKKLGYHNVHVKHADGYLGWEEAAPFDAIIITCAANHVPPPLKDQLADGGRLIIPLGSTTYFQTLTVIKKEKNFFSTRQILGVVFVPMIGKIFER